MLERQHKLSRVLIPIIFCVNRQRMWKAPCNVFHTQRITSYISLISVRLRVNLQNMWKAGNFCVSGDTGEVRKVHQSRRGSAIYSIMYLLDLCWSAFKCSVCLPMQKTLGWSPTQYKAKDQCLGVGELGKFNSRQGHIRSENACFKA